jgi:transposase
LPAVARLVAADEDTVRDVIHLVNAKGLAALDPRWAGGRPRLISDHDMAVIVAAAGSRPETLDLPFTHWSLRKLAAYLAGRGRPVRISRERLRQLLHARGISFQRTRTWKGSHDPDRDAKLDRIEREAAASRGPQPAARASDGRESLPLTRRVAVGSVMSEFGEQQWTFERPGGLALERQV